MDSWGLTDQQLVESLQRLDFSKVEMSQKQWRNVLQTFCQNVLWLPLQSTRRLSDGTGIFEEHLTRTKRNETVSRIEDNIDLMSHGGLKYHSRYRSKFTFPLQVSFSPSIPFTYKFPFSQELLESRKH